MSNENILPKSRSPVRTPAKTPAEPAVHHTSPKRKPARAQALLKPSLGRVS